MKIYLMPPSPTKLGEWLEEQEDLMTCKPSSFQFSLTCQSRFFLNVNGIDIGCFLWQTAPAFDTSEDSSVKNIFGSKSLYP